MDLSVIIPFCNENPQIQFTLRNIASELENRDITFEVIAVNNHCQQNEEKGHEDDGGGMVIEAVARLNPWLKYIHYKDKLSHWNAKRVAVEQSSGNVLFFVDGHVIVSRDAIYGMYKHYVDNYDELNGSIHLPLTYKPLESRKLIYKLHIEAQHYYWYKFTQFTSKYYPQDRAFEVPCMSCCGIMLSREMYDLTGGWPKHLGVYGGGEHFMNYTLSVLGKSKWIYPFGTCYHYGAPRGYEYWYDDYIKNICLAHYLFGGEQIARNFVSIAKGKPVVLNQILDEIMRVASPQRAFIKSNQVISITEWAKVWGP